MLTEGELSLRCTSSQYSAVHSSTYEWVSKSITVRFTTFCLGQEFTLERLWISQLLNFIFRSFMKFLLVFMIFTVWTLFNKTCSFLKQCVEGSLTNEVVDLATTNAAMDCWYKCIMIPFRVATMKCCILPSYITSYAANLKKILNYFPFISH